MVETIALIFNHLLHVSIKDTYIQDRPCQSFRSRVINRHEKIREPKKSDQGIM